MFDATLLLKNFDGDVGLVFQLVRPFADTASKQMPAIRSAVAERDSQTLAHASHLLKGSVADLRAQTVVDAAARLEQIGCSEDLSTAETALSAFELEIGPTQAGAERSCTGELQ